MYPSAAPTGIAVKKIANARPRERSGK